MKCRRFPIQSPCFLLLFFSQYAKPDGNVSISILHTLFLKLNSPYPLSLANKNISMTWFSGFNSSDIIVWASVQVNTLGWLYIFVVYKYTCQPSLSEYILVELLFIFFPFILLFTFSMTHRLEQSLYNLVYIHFFSPSRFFFFHVLKVSKYLWIWGNSA